MAFTVNRSLGAIMQAAPPVRLMKEADEIRRSYAGVLDLEIREGDASMWFVHFKGAEGTIYAGEPFTLRFKFSREYPIESPEVVFVGTPPTHEHVYPNGFICLSILYADWSPVLKVSTVCMSILSMLSSATHKSAPAGGEALRMYSSPKQVSWAFHDDKC